MFKSICGIFGALCIASVCMGMVQPRATQIQVSSNNFGRIVGTNAQQAFDWIDDNVLDQTSGYVTVTYLNSRSFASTTNEQTWTSAATQSFYTVEVRNALTNEHGASFGRMQGVVIDMPSTYTSVIDHTVSTNLTYITTETFDGNNWYNGTNITPNVQGYYLLGAVACVTGNSARFQWKYDTSTYALLMSATNDGLPHSGSTVMYANGTNSFTLMAQNLGASGNLVITNLRMFVTFLGR